MYGLVVYDHVVVYLPRVLERSVIYGLGIGRCAILVLGGKRRN